MPVLSLTLVYLLILFYYSFIIVDSRKRSQKRAKPSPGKKRTNLSKAHPKSVTQPATAEGGVEASDGNEETLDCEEDEG